MPRQGRVVAVSEPHHITQGGDNRQSSSLCEEDGRFYLDTLHDECAIHGVSLLGYCLLPIITCI